MNALKRIERRWLCYPDIQSLTRAQAGIVIDVHPLITDTAPETDSDESLAYNSAAMSLPIGWNEIKALSMPARTEVERSGELLNDKSLLSQVVIGAETAPAFYAPENFILNGAVAVADPDIMYDEYNDLSA